MNEFGTLGTYIDMRLNAAARADHPLEGTHTTPSAVVPAPQAGRSRGQADTTAEAGRHAASTDAHQLRLSSFASFVNESRTGLQRVVVAHHGLDVGLEALAEAYAYAWAHWARIQPMANPVGYVFRTADRAAIRILRQQDGRAPTSRETRSDERTVHGGFETPGHPADISAWGADPAMSVRSETMSMLARLSPQQRSAVLLIHGYGYSYSEAARLLDVPVTSLTNHLFRGVRRLRSMGRPS